MILSSKSKRDLKKLQSDIDLFRIKFENCDYNNDREEFFSLMHEFWNYISNYEDGETYSIFEHTKYFSKYKELFASLQRYYFRTYECIESIMLLTNSIWKNGSFFDFYNKVRAKEVFLHTNAEIKLANFSNCKTLTMVWTWAFPETILYIYENTNINNIIWLDTNQEAVFIASELVKSQNITRINFKHFNWENYDYSNTDLIFVWNFCLNKKKIFERIANTAKPWTKILLRNPVLFGRMLHEDTMAALHPRFALIRKSKVNKFFLIESLLIKILDI